MATSPGRLRVIGGAFRGRKLRVPQGTTVRPTADRVREALFDILGPGAVAARFLDAYAGTGAIGIEALSRGADQVTFVESDRETAKLLEANIAVVGSTPCAVRLMQMDLARAISTLEREGAAFSHVYLDPPFGGGEMDRALRLLSRSRLLEPSSVVIGEHGSDVAPPASERLVPARTASYGRVSLTFFRVLPLAD